MSLPGGVQSAIPWAPGFDCDSPIPAALAVQFYNLGYKFCIRCISRGPESSQGLTEQEATEILNAGLALMPVQHAHKQGWSPNPTLGQQDGQEAAVNAQVVGFPDGVTVWCDLEGGYQIIQLSPSVRLNGMPMPIDFDIAQNDNEDGAASEFLKCS